MTDSAREDIVRNGVPTAPPTPLLASCHPKMLHPTKASELVIAQQFMMFPKPGETPTMYAGLAVTTTDGKPFLTIGRFDQCARDAQGDKVMSAQRSMLQEKYKAFLTGQEGKTPRFTMRIKDKKGQWRLMTAEIAASSATNAPAQTVCALLNVDGKAGGVFLGNPLTDSTALCLAKFTEHRPTDGAATSPHHPPVLVSIAPNVDRLVVCFMYSVMLSFTSNERGGGAGYGTPDMTYHEKGFTRAL